jgi:hypothetical protein
VPSGSIAFLPHSVQHTSNYSTAEELEDEEDELANALMFFILVVFYASPR